MFPSPISRVLPFPRFPLNWALALSDLKGSMFGYSIGLTGIGFDNVSAASTRDKSERLYPLPTGGKGNANFLDTNCEYLLDGRGRPIGMSSIGQRVFLSLFTIQGSTPDPNFGRRPFPLVLTEKTVPTFELIVREALGKLVAARLIRIDSVSNKTEPLGRSVLIVNWSDLTTHQPQSVSLRA